ncbi:major capsid protein [Comamonas aquatica]|uniref:Methyltransferase n=1 Tax=Comamonas aquatica TaxID=225991 RepID=A0AA35D8F2_9BURK|nr:major capsid protein [Comamonas aquatica]CAB5696708.1 Uncharacterised protein [Comamonas aquatica]CAC9685039.1 Uncharacterised protein [Comamonas aquatica]
MSKAIKARLAAIPAFVLATAGTAHAALPTGISDAIDAAKTDMETAVGLVIGAMVVIWGLLKLASKLGWR